MAGPSKRSKQLPLVEVYCEFVFEPPEGETWDWLRICEFARKIDGDFPQRRMLRQHGEPARLGADENEAYWEEGDADQATPLFRFATEDGLTTVQIGENLLVVNRLPVENPRPPYGAVGEILPLGSQKHFDLSRRLEAGADLPTLFALCGPHLHPQERL